MLPLYPILLIYYSFLYFLRQAVADDYCESFTVSTCDHSSKKHDGPLGLDETTCQNFCLVYDDTKFYRYQRPGKTCECFSEDYRQDCALVGGNAV